MHIPVLLAAFSLACLGGERDPSGPDPSSLTQEEINGIRLTYICGNTFRVRNPAAEVVMVTWDVYGTQETGTLALPPRPAGLPYSETYFTTVNKGTVRLSRDGRLIQTKANGNRPVCQTPADTARPPLPSSTTWPTGPLPSVVSTRNPNYTYYRTVIPVQFHDSTSGIGVRQFLARFQATIIGGQGAGSPAPLYILLVPDPGPTFEALDSLRATMNAHPGVDLVLLEAKGEEIQLRARFPVDSGFALRSGSWFNPANVAVRPFLAVRAPLAWGCENGLYSPVPPSIAVADAFFEQVPDDLSGSVVRLVRPSLTESDAASAAFLGAGLDHGVGVTGLLAARGDNGRGIAGMMWRSRTTLYAFGNQQSKSLSPVRYLGTVLFDASGSQIRVLNLAFGVGDVGADTNVVYLRRRFMDYLDSGGLIIVAAGDNALRLPRPQIAVSQDTSLRTSDKALAQLALLAAYKNRIVFVAGTDPTTGAITASSNAWTGASTIAAPGTDIASLQADGRVRTYTGTSFAAPFVAGAAAQLLAMDPTLSASQIVDYLLRGAREPRPDPLTGTLSPPNDVGVAGVYQLDAYGALTLLSRERPGVPLCGASVQVRGQGVVARHGSQVRTLYTLPDGVGVGAIRGAQGGRLLAVGLSTEDPLGISQELRLVGGTWQPSGQQQAGVFKEYLERDTVEYLFSLTEATRLSLKRSNGSVTLLPSLWSSPDGPEGAVISPDLGTVFAPSAEFAVVSALYRQPGPTGAECLEQHRTYLFPIGSAPPSLVREGQQVDMCSGDTNGNLAALGGGFETAISQDSRTLGSARFDYRLGAGGFGIELEETNLEMRQVTNTTAGGPVVTVAVPFQVRPGAFSADGVLLTFEEFAATCTHTTRLTTSLVQVASEACAGLQTPRPLNAIALTAASSLNPGILPSPSPTSPRTLLRTARPARNAREWLRARAAAARVN